LNFPDLAVWANTSLDRTRTGLNGKTSSFWTVALAGACLFRRQKNQSETMKAMSAIPPTVPPTMAPKLGVVEGAVAAVGDGGEVLVLVLVPVGVLLNWDEPEVGVGVLPVAETVGVLVDWDKPEVGVGVLTETVGLVDWDKPEVGGVVVGNGREELLDTPETVLEGIESKNESRARTLLVIMTKIKKA